MNRRAQIRMTAAEVASLLDAQRTVICATNGPDGFPHLMPLWYVVRDGELWSWTFAKSQKVRNLERDPRATLQIEAGTTYEQLRGVMLRCDVILHRDTDAVAALGSEIFVRYRSAGTGELDDDVRALVDAQSPKRVALQFAERARVTWDHRKLAAGVA